MLQSLLRLRRQHLRLQHLLLRSRLLQRHLLLLRLKRLPSLRQLLRLLRLRLSPLHRPFRLSLQHRPQCLRLLRSHLPLLRNKRKRLPDPDQFRPPRTASHCDRLLKMLLLSARQLPRNNGPASLALKGLQQQLRRVPARSRNVLCLLEIAVRFQQGTAAPCPPAIVAHFLRAIGRAVRVPVNLCVRNRVAKAVLTLLAPVDKVVPEVRKIVLRMDSVQARLLLARDRDRVSPVGPACSLRRLLTKCLPRLSQASPSTRAARHSDSAQVPTNARWKASASFIRLASAPAPATAALRPSSLRQSRVCRATSTSPKASPFANLPKNSTCAPKTF